MSGLLIFRQIFDQALNCYMYFWRVKLILKNQAKFQSTSLASFCQQNTIIILGNLNFLPFSESNIGYKRSCIWQNWKPKELILLNSNTANSDLVPTRVSRTQISQWKWRFHNLFRSHLCAHQYEASPLLDNKTRKNYRSRGYWIKFSIQRRCERPNFKARTVF